MRLTITCDRGRLKELETVCTLEGRDLSVGELREELRLFVVLEVDVALREVDLQPCESSSRADLDAPPQFLLRRRFNCTTLTVFPFPCPGTVQRVPMDAILRDEGSGGVEES